MRHLLSLPPRRILRGDGGASVLFVVDGRFCGAGPTPDGQEGAHLGTRNFVKVTGGVPSPAQVCLLELKTTLFSAVAGAETPFRRKESCAGQPNGPTSMGHTMLDAATAADKRGTRGEGGGEVGMLIVGVLLGRRTPQMGFAVMLKTILGVEFTASDVQCLENPRHGVPWFCPVCQKQQREAAEMLDIDED